VQNPTPLPRIGELDTRCVDGDIITKYIKEALLNPIVQASTFNLSIKHTNTTALSEMTRVLLTGGSGFIAAHTLKLLLERGHFVVTTVRTQAKADKIKSVYRSYSDKGLLDFAIVPDIADPNAFEEAVISDPPFEVVLHTASPFHFNVTDVKKVNWTRGLL